MATSKQKQIGSLELKKSKKGTAYLSGTIFGNDYIVFKSREEFMKEHPTAPNYSGYEDLDYEDGEERDYCVALWSRVSKDGNRYISGVVSEKNIVAFYDEDSQTFRVYESREGSKKKTTKKKTTKKSKPAEDREDLPF